MSNFEIVKHEGLDDRIWYVLFSLVNGKRTAELTRSSNFESFIESVRAYLSE